MRRGVAFAAVVALHVGLVVALTLALRTPAPSSSATDFVSSLVFLPAPLPLAAPAKERSQPANQITAPLPVERLSVAIPQIDFPTGAQPSIDWDAEARRAAGAVTAAPAQVREFGQIPQAPSWLGSTRAASAHQAGDQYRLETGEWVIWVSDRCYILSQPAPLGMPDVFAHSLGTQMACQAPPGPPPGELFKDLPAYKKYHPP